MNSSVRVLIELMSKEKDYPVGWLQSQRVNLAHVPTCLLFCMPLLFLIYIEHSLLHRSGLNGQPVLGHLIKENSKTSLVKTVTVSDTLLYIIYLKSFPVIFWFPSVSGKLIFCHYFTKFCHMSYVRMF